MDRVWCYILCSNLYYNLHDELTLSINPTPPSHLMKTACRILFLVFAASMANAQDAREIIRHYIDTVSGGSIKNWDKVATLYYEGQSYYSQNDFEQKSNLLNPDKPGYFRTHLDSKAHKSKNELFADSSFEIR